MKTGLIVTTLLVLTLAYTLYTPVPDSIEGAWKLRLGCGLLKQIGRLAEFGEMIGVGSTLNNTRAILNGVLSLYSKITPSRGVVTIDDTIEGVPVRIYYPEKKPSNMAPGLIYLHGGGWVEGNLESFDGFIRILTAGVSSITISIDYRLAPEHPFPAPFEDCVKVTQYVLKNGKEFGIDTSRIAIAGDSAGGQLTAAVSLKLRHHKPPPKAQLLLYPALQSVDLNTPSYQYNEKHFDGGVMLSRVAMAFFYTTHALGHPNDIPSMLEGKHVHQDVSKTAKSSLDYNVLPKDEIMKEFVKPIVKKTDKSLGKKLKDVMLNPYYNTLLAPDVSGVPEAYVVTCQYDVLRDDGIWYAKKLEKAGVKVTLDHLDNGFHGFNLFVGILPDADKAKDRMITFLKRVLK